MIFDLEENDSIQRNENICRIFSKTMYMEHVGTGIKRMKDEMRGMVYQNRNSWNRVNFLR